MRMGIHKAVKRTGGILLGGCLLAGLLTGFSAFAADGEGTVIGGVPNEETGMIDYIIGADAKDTVVLDGTVMEQFILNKAWDEKPHGWVPGDTSGRPDADFQPVRQRLPCHRCTGLGLFPGRSRGRDLSRRLRYQRAGRRTHPDGVCSAPHSV